MGNQVGSKCVAHGYGENEVDAIRNLATGDSVAQPRVEDPFGMEYKRMVESKRVASSRFSRRSYFYKY